MKPTSNIYFLNIIKSKCIKINQIYSFKLKHDIIQKNIKSLDII